MASDGYFNVEPSPTERAIVQYIVASIDSITKKPSSSIRYQKIVFDVAQKLDLPLTRMWYKFGAITPTISAFSAINVTGNVESQLQAAIGYDLFEKILPQVKNATAIFPHDFTFQQVRRKQYEEYQNKKYLLLYDLGELFNSGFSRNTDVIFQKLSDFLILVSESTVYNEFYEMLFDYLLTLKKIAYTKSVCDDEIVKNSFGSIQEYFITVEGMTTVVGPLAAKLKASLSKDIQQVRYDANASLNQIKLICKLNAVPFVSITSESSQAMYDEFVEADKSLWEE